MPIAACPETAAYQNFLEGRLSAEENAQVAEHLETCDRCTRMIQELPEDELVGVVRAARNLPAQEDDPQSLELLIQKVLLLRQSGDTQTRLPPDTGADSDSSNRPTEYDFLAPPQEKDELGRLGNYRVMKVLGQGGMGMVFQAEDLHLKRPVALKVMLPKLGADPAARERFLREARAAAAVRHDHVVTIYQAGEAGDVAFLAMELLDGQTLEDRLRGQTALPTREALRIGREIAEGLAAAHQRGLIHRDVKPANIWLEKSGRVKLLDFGLARPVEGDSQLTSANAVLGTPAFMSPEQANADPIDARSDLFSLGCVLYRLCTGRPAFAGTKPLRLLRAIVHDNPMPPRQVKADVPAELSDLVMRLLAKDAAGRPESAGAAADTLRKIDTVAAASSRKRLPGWAIAGGLAAAILAIAAGIVIYWPTPQKNDLAKKKKDAPKVNPPRLVPLTVEEKEAKKLQADWAEKLRLPLEAENTIGMKLILIPPAGAALPTAYYLGKYEVTQGEWKQVMGLNPSSFAPPNEKVARMDTSKFPVEMVTWFDCVEFCNMLSKREGMKPYYDLRVTNRGEEGRQIEEAKVKISGGNGYHIPTDAEWEHGCRAGTKTRYHCGDDDEDLLEYAWFDKNSDGRTHAVGEKKPNAFGLYDMHGNIREWNEEMLTNAKRRTPERVRRGGNWFKPAADCAVSERNHNSPDNLNHATGLRLARIP
jgi:eukaryotic-like serine/threonine-protein kinase